MKLAAWSWSVGVVVIACSVMVSSAQDITEGAVDLALGPTSDSGFVEIYHDNQWGSVCDTYWGVDNAHVVCIELGYTGAEFPVVGPSGTNPLSSPVILDEVECTGDETALIDCPSGGWDEMETGCMPAWVQCIPHAIPTHQPGPVKPTGNIPTEAPVPPIPQPTQPTPPTPIPSRQPTAEIPTEGTVTGTTDNTVLYAVVGVVSVVLILIFVAVILCFIRRYMTRRRQPGVKDTGTREIIDSPKGTTSVTASFGSPVYVGSDDQDFGDIYEDVGLPSWANQWEIVKRNLVVDDKVIGRGDFGEVRSGRVNKGGKTTVCAIKILKDQASMEDKLGFMEEFRTMTSIGHHPNVVSLIGACQSQDVLYVALEYLPNGDLRSFLRKARPVSGSGKAKVSSGQLIQFAFDVAKGMKHLAMSGVIHRDLAARNVLLGEGLVAKVSDFGLSRGEDIYVQTSKGAVPTRWLAMESLLHNTYSSQSDVWSFGILLWEIATLGGTPYPSVDSKSLAGKLTQGYRMGKPINCSDEIYALMRRCWLEDPKKRPTFADLIVIFGKMSQNKKVNYFALSGPKHYDNLSAIRPDLEGN